MMPVFNWRSYTKRHTPVKNWHHNSSKSQTWSIYKNVSLL